MNTEIKRILGRFFICSTVIFVAVMIISGKIFTDQKGQEIFSAVSYASVSVESDKDKIVLTAGEEMLEIRKALPEKILQIKKYAVYTPLGAVIKAAQAFSQMIRGLRI